ncbi:MAG TPA: hypothetical protein VH497_04555 [Vicinamibacterales bacterium]
MARRSGAAGGRAWAQAPHARTRKIADNRRIRSLDTDSGRAASTFALFALLAVIHTWPLASAPSQLSRHDNADALLNQWILSWDAHQAATDPLHLFDANIFYPETRTLAYSEYLLVPAAIGAPILWLGGSPTLEYNLLILIGLTLTGWTGSILVHRWTGDRAAGIIGGVIIAFNAHTLTRLPQLQALHVEFLPLALLAFDEIITEDRWSRSVAWLALVMALTGVTSYYSLVIAIVALAAAWMVRVDAWRGGRAAGAVTRVALAAALSLVVLGPALIPYARIGQVRSLEEIALYSASARDYLASPARVHFGTWSARFFGGTTALFPGVTALIFSAAALVSGLAFRNRRARMALALGLAGIALSFGPALPGHALLYQALLPLQGIRNVARFGYLATVAAGILAGFGVAQLRARWPGARWMPAAIAVVFCAANLDAFSAPIEYVRPEAVDAIHARLRGSNAIVAEFPFYPPDRVFRHAPYLLHSVAHWRSMLNGYSGLTPDSFVRHARALARFPDAQSIDTLRALGVTHVFVHDRALRDWTDNETADAVRRAPGLHLIVEDADVGLYEVR